MRTRQRIEIDQGRSHLVRNILAPVLQRIQRAVTLTQSANEWRVGIDALAARPEQVRSSA